MESSNPHVMQKERYLYIYILNVSDPTKGFSLTPLSSNPQPLQMAAGRPLRIFANKDLRTEVMDKCHRT